MTDSPEKISPAPSPEGVGEAPPTDETKPHGRQGRHGPRRRVVVFVLVFVVCVLCLLTGYRFAIPTKPNDFYLFQVGRQTSWLLARVGHSSSIEDPERVGEPAALVRATLRAWDADEPAPNNVEPSATPEPPLTAWEAWHYRAERTRRDQRNPEPFGPLVSFVFKPGIATFIRETVTAKQRTLKDPELDDATRAQRLAELQIEQERLEEERRQAKAAGEPPVVIRGLSFPFTVVPDCGAIPSMSIFFAAVAAFPARWWKRVLGVVLGLPILYGVNCFRLACLAVIGAWDQGAGHGGKYFTFCHEFVWQGLYIVIVVVVWMLWVEYIVGRKES